MLIPLVLTLVFIACALLLVIMLARAAWKHRNPPIAASHGVPPDLKEFGPSSTNRWVRGLRSFLILLILAVLGMHGYWVFWADSNKSFTQAQRLDARNLRLAESGLKGWVLDRSGKLENALIRYRSDAGRVAREYPLGEAAVHITGYSDYVFGSGGLEYAFRGWLTAPASLSNELASPVPVGKDLKVSVDSSFQRTAYNLIKGTGKPGAAVVLLLPGNEVLAMVSAPSFDPLSLTNEDTWRRLSQQADDAPELSPLVNRALGTLVTGGSAFYYRPGSTFKTFTAAVAIESGVTNERFTCRADGFTPPGSNRAIRDYEGEVHGTLGFQDAFRFSCNQYFAQLGLKLGRERMANYARRLGFATSPEEGSKRALDIWQADKADAKDFNFIFAPPAPRMNLSAKATSYDLALEAFGQGFDDLTVFKMALIAAAAAENGALVPPTFEVGAERKIVGQFVSPQSAARLKE